MRVSKQLIVRRDFMRKLCQAGLTYKQASAAYTSIMAMLRESVLSGHRIKFGDVGALIPVVKPPKAVVMGIERCKNGEYVRSRRVFHLGERLSYRFKFFDEFARKHQLG